MRPSRSLFLIAVSIALATTTVGAGPAWECSGPPALPLNDTPEGAVQRMMLAYAARNLDEYAAMLTADYKFTSIDPDFGAAFPLGSTRADEIRMAEHLFHGFTDASGVAHPRAVSIALTVGPLVAPGFGRSELQARPDSELVQLVAPVMHMIVSLEGGETMTIAGPFEFTLVRGGHARMTGSMGAEVPAWYVRRCAELSEDDPIARAVP
jgi:hypothetical protein